MKTHIPGIESGLRSTPAPCMQDRRGRIRVGDGRLAALLVSALLLSGLFLLLAKVPAMWLGVFLGAVAGVVLVGVTTTGSDDKKIKAGKLRHAGMDSLVFKLTLGNEMVALDPGKTWAQVDHYKWVARGLIEAPQSFQVAADGSVRINSAQIKITDPEGSSKLEHEISKRHEGTVAHKGSPLATLPHPAAVKADPAAPRFRVRLDHWGHMLIEWGHGVEREETGLRGLAALFANGLLRKPERFHVDAMQRGVEMDEAWYECSEPGAKALEVALNTRYAVGERIGKSMAIEIKENRAASTGFDIHFTIVRAGIPFDIKGHLTQENLDLLQDQARCDLLQPGIHLLLSPPYLLFRKRRPDLGEDKIPELPDVNLLRINATQLQALLNHPGIRRGGSGPAAPVAPAVGERPEEMVAMRVVRNAEDKVLLWLECLKPGGQTPGVKAFTHHNIAELQQGGFFQPQLYVSLSLDHRRLSILNHQTKQEEALTLDPRSPDEVLSQAGRLLTNALKPPTPAAPLASTATVGGELVGAQPVSAGELVVGAEPKPTVEALPGILSGSAVANLQPAPPMAPGVVEHPGPPVASKPGLDPITARFRETDAVRINLEVFRRLGEWLGIPTQDVLLSLPHVFENRRFEVLDFEQKEVNSLMELRGEDFYGFYLSHVNDQKTLLVYACNGTHIEWGPDKCVLQPTARSEAEEYRGSALLGLAQDWENVFVFIVQPEFKEWIVPREQPYTVENVRFLAVADIAAAPENFRVIWPEASPPPG